MGKMNCTESFKKQNFCNWKQNHFEIKSHLIYVNCIEKQRSEKTLGNFFFFFNFMKWLHFTRRIKLIFSQYLTILKNKNYNNYLCIKKTILSDFLAQELSVHIIYKNYIINFFTSHIPYHIQDDKISYIYSYTIIEKYLLKCLC